MLISHSTEVNVECVEKVKILNAYYEYISPYSQMLNKMFVAATLLY